MRPSHRVRKGGSSDFCPRLSASRPSCPIRIQGTKESLGNHEEMQGLKLVARLSLSLLPWKGQPQPGPDVYRERRPYRPKYTELIYVPVTMVPTAADDKEAR